MEQKKQCRLMDTVRYLFAFWKDEKIEIRIRLLILLEVVASLVCVTSAIFMLLLRQSFSTILPNILLFALCLYSLWLSNQGKHDLATILLILGGADITLPVMYFYAGGVHSGMVLWFTFGVLVACMMSKGRTRWLMVTLTVLVDVGCMFYGYIHPESITPLTDEVAVFYDIVESFIMVCIALCALLVVHIITYEDQHRTMERQQMTVNHMLLTDELTNTRSRRAYYDAIRQYAEKEDYTLAVVMMDVNGLKNVNDTMGHLAGDALLRAAANVMMNAFSKYGEIYRMGGDEFSGLLHCTTTEASELRDRLKACIQLSDEPSAKDLTIAMGVVHWEHNRNKSFSDLEKMADELMYVDKSEFYRQSGRDRRHDSAGIPV